MPYDENLGERIRHYFGDDPNVREVKMMGGLIFMVHDHMTCGVHDNSLMVRVGSEDYESTLKQKHVTALEIGAGRTPRAFVCVAQPGIKTQKMLSKWIERGMEYVATLPKKRKKKIKKKTRRK